MLSIYKYFEQIEKFLKISPLTPSVKPLGLILQSGLRILHLLECMIFLSLLISRCKNHPPPMPHDLCMFSHVINT